MLDIIDAILRTLLALTEFRYTFVGIFVGWGLNLIVGMVVSNATDDPTFIIIGTCILTGFVLDIRRIFKE